MIWRIALLCVFCSNLNGQHPLLDTLAVKVCDCMDAAPELVYPRLQATHCVTRVSTTYAGRIRSELQLSTRRASDRQRLGELLVDPLTAGCPLLRELGPGILEPQLQYSDFSLLERVPAAEVSKHPLPDPTMATTREAADLLRVRGTLTEGPNDDHLRVLLTTGEVKTFLLPRGLQRKLELQRGQPVTVVYQEDWRTDGRSIQPVAVRIE